MLEPHYLVCIWVYYGISHVKRENQELKSGQAQEIAILKEEIGRNRKATQHALNMVEAVKGAIAAKSEAARFTLNL
jgi:hypothetical protein